MNFKGIFSSIGLKQNINSIQTNNNGGVFDINETKRKILRAYNNTYILNIMKKINDWASNNFWDTPAIKKSEALSLFRFFNSDVKNTYIASTTINSLMDSIKRAYITMTIAGLQIAFDLGGFTNQDAVENCYGSLETEPLPIDNPNFSILQEFFELLDEFFKAIKNRNIELSNIKKTEVLQFQLQLIPNLINEIINYYDTFPSDNIEPRKENVSEFLLEIATSFGPVAEVTIDAVHELVNQSLIS